MCVCVACTKQVEQTRKDSEFRGHLTSRLRESNNAAQVCMCVYGEDGEHYEGLHMACTGGSRRIVECSTALCSQNHAATFTPNPPQAAAEAQVAEGVGRVEAALRAKLGQMQLQAESLSEALGAVNTELGKLAHTQQRLGSMQSHLQDKLTVNRNRQQVRRAEFLFQQHLLRDDGPVLTFETPSQHQTIHSHIISHPHILTYLCPH